MSFVEGVVEKEDTVINSRDPFSNICRPGRTKCAPMTASVAAATLLDAVIASLLPQGVTQASFVRRFFLSLNIALCVFDFRKR